MAKSYHRHLRAAFEPSDVKLLTATPTAKLLTENPTLVSALSQIFPYLLLIDNLLSILTWTNDDHYENFLYMIIYSFIVMYWNWVSHFILPLLIASTFASVVWTISSVVHACKWEDPPTIDEVLYTLHNITVRCEMLFQPLKHLPFKLENYIRMFLTVSLLTPLHLIFTKYNIITPQKYLWLVGLSMFSFHAPWAFAIRRLLWRSTYVRIAAIYITGFDIKLKKSSYSARSIISNPSTTDVEDLSTSLSSAAILGDFKIVQKSVVSPTQIKQLVLFEILENERRWIGMGWSSLLYPTERSNFCYEGSYNSAPNINETKEFPFPIFENDIYSYRWEWLDTEWKLDPEFSKSKSKEGWVFYDSSWKDGRGRDGFSRFTRSRKWTRRANLLIDKQKTVYDE
ncbi:uncharacterized protein J8A68_000996 [[Candida] subhashii]|uniref:TECPR1-like DysF domain-containing protein n=1 Tax=[Candida] subhashii TaxID=561895 RepID=A0A8J5QP66_9ASCO|nr:uncharacterized protein J8A68_000996 [[Candida] subhashii]KAG7665308.1 hypothetical protein J8A68_000996 [[Candida] subhashii]